MAQSQIELVGGGRRLAAAIIDAIILGVLDWLLIKNEVVSGRTSATVAVILIYFVYYWVQHGMWGQTLGKRAMGIKLMTVNGDEIGWGAAAWRLVFAIALSLLTLGVGALIDVAWILRDSDSRALHDKVAGTWVVEAEHGEADPYGTADPYLRR